MNRRQALKSLGALSILSRRLPAQSTAAAFLKQHPSFDLHCHPGMFAEATDPQAFEKTVADMRAGGLTAAFFALVADAKMLTRDAGGQIVVNGKLPEGATWADCLRQLDVFTQFAKRANVALATTLAQMKEQRSRGQVAAFLSCEGGHGLEGNLDRLDVLYQRGVRSLQLTHYAQNTLGDLQTLPAVYHGLSPFGGDVVRRMNRLGMVVDVAHASFDTVKQVVEITASPIMLSHTHLQSKTTPHPRLITVEHARLVASTGGIIGAWPSGFVNHTLSDFVDETMKLIDAAGIDHVGLGTDMDGNYKPVFSSYRQLPEWTAGLRSKGLSDTDLAKVVGGNALRVIGQVLKS